MYSNNIFFYCGIKDAHIFLMYTNCNERMRLRFFFILFVLVKVTERFVTRDTQNGNFQCFISKSNTQKTHRREKIRRKYFKKGIKKNNAT